MSVNRGLWVPLNGNVGTTPTEARLVTAGQVAENAPGVPRQGLLFQSATEVVAGTSAMEYTVAACHPVISRAVNDGVYTLTLTGSTIVPTTVAPATGSRWDLVFVKQNDTAKGDADNLPIVGVVQGVASSTPSKPYGSVPEGAMVLAEVSVQAGAIATNGSGVTITQMWRHTAMRGAPIPVRSKAERDEITAYRGARVLRLDFGGLEQRFSGAKWHGSVVAGGTFTVPAVPNGGGSGNLSVTYPFTFPGAPAVTVTASSGRLTGTTTSRTSSGFVAVFDNRSGGGSSSALATYTAIYTLAD